MKERARGREGDRERERERGRERERREGGIERGRERERGRGRESELVKGFSRTKCFVLLSEDVNIPLQIPFTAKYGIESGQT